MAKLNWEKARRSELPLEPYRPTTKRRKRLSGAKRDELHKARGEHIDASSGRQHALNQFATAKGLVCFVCGANGNPWAKTGITRERPWAICLPCVQRKRP